MGKGFVVVWQPQKGNLRYWTDIIMAQSVPDKKQKDGPTWNLAQRKITTDLYAGEVLEVLTRSSSEPHGYHAPLPFRPRDIKTTLH